MPGVKRMNAGPVRPAGRGAGGAGLPAAPGRPDDRLTKQVAIGEAILDATLVVLLVFMVFKLVAVRL